MDTTELFTTTDNNTTVIPVDQRTPEDNGPIAFSFRSLLVVLLQCALMIFILSGNTLVIVAVQRFPSLQTTTNQFVISLAAADLLVGLALPFHASVYLLPWLAQQKYLCVCRFTSLLLPCCGSMGCLLLISVDRFIAIVYPLRYPSLMTHHVAVILLVCNWLQTIVQSTVPLYSNQWHDGTECLVTSVLWPEYVIFASFWNVGFVNLVMVALYGKILNVALKQHRSIRQMEMNNTKFSIREVNTTKTLAIVIGTFLCCWGPFMMLVAIKAMGCDVWKYDTLYAVCILMGILNSGMNPVIYAWKNRAFRRAFNKILKRNANQVVPFETTGSSLTFSAG